MPYTPMKRTLYDFVHGNIPEWMRCSPDEYLANMAAAPPLVPVRQRGVDFLLPETELLDAIHYYVATKHPDKKDMFDESALLTFGFLVDQWVRESLGKEGALVYAHVGDIPDFQPPVIKRHKKKITKKEVDVEETDGGVRGESNDQANDQTNDDDNDDNDESQDEPSPRERKRVKVKKEKKLKIPKKSKKRGCQEEAVQPPRIKTRRV